MMNLILILSMSIFHLYITYVILLKTINAGLDSDIYRPIVFKLSMMAETTNSTFWYQFG